ncbi:MAG: LssY C-terminal domain-containing protein [Acidobacteria bacterium]|nr:LssY C-terminal domain-containing protein [Acidobacteriota bacterium]
MRLLVLAWAVGGALLAQAPVSRYDVGKAAAKPSAAGAGGELTVAGSRQWTDTGMDVEAGDLLRFTATGALRWNGREVPPEGIPRAWMDMIKAFPVMDGKRGALVGRVGEGETNRPFLIGPQGERRVAVKGRLFLGVNQAATDGADGAFTVRVERVAGAAKAARVQAPIVKMTDAQLNSVPVRVGDKEGTPGDRVNFFLVGSEVQVVAALKAGDWVTVDRSIKDTILRGALASFSKQAYLTIPMSELYLFDRPQDYGWAHADPLKVVAARHHFRIWKAPFQVGGRTVWAGAGTHDVGFDKDERNGKLTHKIDPETDKERDFIGQSLADTGMVAAREYVTVRNPLLKARTAHGQEFFSDGRTLVIYLEGEEQDASEVFSDTFCSVLVQNNPDTGSWGGCQDWAERAGRTDRRLGPLGKEYRVLVVPGFMSSCFAESPAFEEGTRALRKQYGMTVELLGVGNDGSEVNAKEIARYLNESWKTDQRKWILVGYSKGTPDIQEALAREGIAEKVAAFVSVAGASGGSPIADAMPAQADRWVQQFQFKTCRGDLSAGFKSLGKGARQSFLAAFPEPKVPTYSVVAASKRENTSKALLQTWMLMNAFDPVHDGQLTRQDAIVPGSKYLGVLKGDHFAVALPFDKSPDATVRNNMDKTRYPRAALLEALLRVVQADLAPAGGR